MTGKSIFAAVAALLLGFSANAQTTVVYPQVEGMQTSPEYSATVCGKPVWVETIGPGGMENLNVMNFSCEGTQTVEIVCSEPVDSWSVQPRSAGIKAVAEGNRLCFTIDGPKKLYIRINSLPYLALFANPLEKDAPTAKTRGVDYYGPGVHDLGRVTLKDNQIIYIAGGAVVNANFNGTAKNAKIIGRGSINGNLSVTGCENLTVDGVFFRSSRGWTNTITNSMNTVYSNVKVFSHTGVWGLDGINPVSCKGFRIEDCFIRTRDDCVAIKSNGNPDNFDLSTRDITVTKSLLVGWDHADGVTLGFELNGGEVEGVLVKDCDILRAKGSGRTGGHAAFSIVCDGASNVHDITFEDIRVESDIEYKNLEIILTEAERYGNGKMGSVKNINIRNVSWENAGKPFTIVGHPTRFVEDITFTNCYVGGKLMKSISDADFQIEFARGIRFQGGEEAPVDRYPYSENGGRVPGQRRVDQPQEARK